MQIPYSAKGYHLIRPVDRYIIVNYPTCPACFYVSCRCTGGHLRIWDGRSYDHGFPPNTICGGYGRDDIDMAVFTTGHEAEVEFCASALRPSTSFALSYTFVNTGELFYL